ncbi:MAG: prenyltransferase/squalene oxidase repeat-containing protein [Planctomycetota bacterium]|jgi:squalene-hopene/tetraprenyl-beta-curcumene cyclase
MRTLSHVALVRVVALIAPLAAAAGGQTPTGDPDADPKGIYRQPQRPLDARIDPEKVTAHDPPPLTQQVVLPVPPEFRIAGEAGQVPVSADHFARARKAIDEGLTYLKSAQGPTGGWLTEIRIGPTGQPDQPSPIAVAVTALAVKAMIQADGAVVEDVRFQLALRFVRSAQRDDGAYEGGALTNYVTSMVVMALATIDHQDFRDELRDATSWLEVNQWDQTEGLSPRQDWFGGSGYGNQGRPDLSNTQTMLDALYEAGMSPDEPAVQRALSFVSRAQNLQGANQADWAGTDGGFVYTPANGGESMASEAAGEGRTGRAVAAGLPRSLRSYGSMTYAGFKSMFYAGLSPDDLRVRAAFDWIRRHWTFDENPGLGQQGLYYYYHTMARALRAAQQNVITDIDGNSHNWREELINALTARQRDDGSWQNSADRWLEGQPVMATIFAVLALEEAIKPVLPHE